MAEKSLEKSSNATATAHNGVAILTTSEELIRLIDTVITKIVIKERKICRRKAEA